MRPAPSLLLIATACLAAPVPDPYCSRYPASRNAAPSGRAYAARAKAKAAIEIDLPRANFIDSFLLGKMAADGVTPAPLTHDGEFLRRAHLDLAGRIPQPEEAASFLSDASPGKRARLIERLLASDAYVSQWTLYHANRFRVTRGGTSRVGLERRNAFARYLRDFIQRDRPYDQVVREMLTASGDTDAVPASGFLLQIFTSTNFGPIQDFYDNVTDAVTTEFLGFKTNCVSCHNGRGYLEKINVYLTRKRRSDFWAMAAFFSRMQVVQFTERDFSQYRFYFQDRDTGTYVGTVNPDNPGMRPPRQNATVDIPRYLVTEQTPSGNNWRQEFAGIVTRDRQFARAAVNYLWAAMFRTGIVDPPNAWDLSRVDPENPPPGDWPLQNTHPELLEALTDFYIQNNYRTKALIRLLANSTVWQLSSRYDGTWNPDNARYFSRHDPRRLSAEEIYDAVAVATQTESPMYIPGYAAPLMYANELPDPVEPANDWRVLEILRQFGRGNWIDTDRDNSPTLLGLLYALNGWELSGRTLEANWFGAPVNRVTRIAAMDATDEEMIRRMFLATLTREPTAEEIAAVLERRRGQPRSGWLSRLQWALINKLDFIFNY
jgi:hypothetical protein